MEIVDVPRDEIQPGSSNTMLILAGGTLLLVIAVGGLLSLSKRENKIST
jgi:LPXTG-motif cell wall-anchored protein